MIAISIFIAKDTTAKNPTKIKKSPTYDFNAILTPVFHQIVLDTISGFWSLDEVVGDLRSRVRTCVRTYVLPCVTRLLENRSYFFLKLCS